MITVNSLSRCLSRSFFLFPTALVACLTIFSAVVHGGYDAEPVLSKIEAAYDEVQDYQTEVEVKNYKRDGSVITETPLYTFKKPKWIRLDFVSSYPRMILVYPDKNGKALIRLTGLLSVFRSHLMLNDPRLKTQSGQRIDQTDLGFLIKTIRHSLIDQRRGPVSISEDKNTLQIRVLANDYFRKGLETTYEFLINKELWLPVEVGWSTPDGVQEGRIIFRNLRININVPDSLFQ
jgi:outer membrane lipoprotein-sorting protein